MPDDTPTNAMEETIEDEDDDDSSGSEIFEPENSASKRRPNLLQELGQAGADSTDDDRDGRKSRDSGDSSGWERIDWEGLQEKEDQELKAHGSVKVCSGHFRISSVPRSI
jgi:hypothetical protein